MSLTCNVCGLTSMQTVFDSGNATAISSLGEIMEGGTEVAFCSRCTHLQTREIQNISEYYDRQYTILIDSEDEDQIYAYENGRRIYRYDFQADTALSKLELAHGARVLEYGAAKGATLRKIMKNRSDLECCVFDVSDMYCEFWDSFLEKEAQASYVTPDAWEQSFDCVMSFYVLEHVSDLDGAMNSVRDLLAPGGIFYFIVPNTSENIADFVVADHCNHFSEPSIRMMMSRHGFEVEEIDTQTHSSAFIVVAKKLAEIPVYSVSDSEVATAESSALEIASYWSSITERIVKFESENLEAQSAIYGAGFYGSFIYSSLRNPDRILYCLDQNPHLHGRNFFGVPILFPEEIPDSIKRVYIGLNPKHARQIISELPAFSGRDLELLFL